ncbi:MAG: LysM peptidoglycan-binding domain-containing M23 family metallopeptidase [Candidatus Omnitrophica bacterium]|nr:LysM peptidoglycan-binding domain-containing M23 family metallopeptidase [Candidatus Omnitrophota bacterium]MDD5591724.1 LysM peptidoglycan-binding domain-containing M23 family metallopeptidase [Candidatus Omnitrophota bacterium]
MLKLKSSLYLIHIICYLLFLAGCAPTPYIKPTPPKGIPGIYHRVERGQTLWQISKIYNVDLDEIVGINHIPDAAAIDAGQLIFIPHRQKTQYLTSKGQAENFIWPARGKVISTFGQTFNNMLNKGLNIQCYHNPDVLASRSGKIVFSDDNFGGFGRTIIIDHGDGFLTVYARNSQILVKNGSYVQRGAVIAKAGYTDNDKNTYLHFEIRKGHIPQNPYFYLP